MEIEIQRDPGADAIARYLGIDLRELAERDRFQQPLARWLAYDGHRFVGLATAFVRADDRLFVTHRLQDEAAFGPLLHAAVEDTAAQDTAVQDTAVQDTAVQDTAVQETTSPINLSIGLDQNERLRIARQAGFVTDLSARAYDVPFRPALERIAAFRTAALLPPALQSNTVEIVQADEVSLDELFALDTELREDVPGVEATEPGGRRSGCSMPACWRPADGGRPASRPIPLVRRCSAGCERSARSKLAASSA